MISIVSLAPCPIAARCGIGKVVTLMLRPET